MLLQRQQWIVFLLIVLMGGSIAWILARGLPQSPEMREPGQVATEANTQKVGRQPDDVTSAKSARKQRLRQIIQELIDEDGATMADATDEVESRELREQKQRQVVQKLIDDGALPPVGFGPVEESTVSQPEESSMPSEEERAKQILEQVGPLEAAQYLADQHRYDELTVSYARQAVLENPNSVKALLLLGMVIRDREEEAVICRRVLELERDSVDALVRLGGMLAYSEPWASLRYSERLINVASATGHEYLSSGYFNLGLAYERLGKYDEAIEAYRTSQIGPAEGRILRIQTGDPIIPPLDTSSPPTDMDASRSGDSSEALPTSTTVTDNVQEDLPYATSPSMRTDEPQTTVQDAQEQESGESGDARDWYQRLAAERPEVVSQAHYELARELVKAGQFEEAAEDLHRAIELNPQHTDSYRELARVYERIQDTERATIVYQQALERFPEAERLRREWETFRNKHLRDDAPKRPEQDK